MTPTVHMKAKTRTKTECLKAGGTRISNMTFSPVNFALVNQTRTDYTKVATSIWSQVVTHNIVATPF